MHQDGWLNPSIFLEFNRVKLMRVTSEDVLLAAEASDELEIADVEGVKMIRRHASLPDYKDWDEDELARSFFLKRIPEDATVQSIQNIFSPIAIPVFVRVYRSRTDGKAETALLCFEDTPTANRVWEQVQISTPESATGIIMKKRLAAADNPEQIMLGSTRASNTVVNPDLYIFQLLDLPDQMPWKQLYELVAARIQQHSDVTLRYLLYTQNQPHAYVTVTKGDDTKAMIAKFSEDGIELADATYQVKILEEEADIAKYWQTANEYREKRKVLQNNRENRTPYRNFNSEELMERNPPGVIVRIDGFSNEVTWQQIKAELQVLGTLVFINYSKKNNICFARFSSPSQAREVCEQLAEQDEMTLCGCDIQANVLQGEEEREYWTQAEEYVKKRHEKTRGQGSDQDEEET